MSTDWMAKPHCSSMQRAAILALLVLGSVLVSPGVALAWNPFGENFGPPSATRDPVDRTFTREWEANPPPGYPTLSPANVAATKAAIARYREIAAAGGWPILADKVLRTGMSDPEVAVLRQRLKLTGDLKDEGWSQEGFDYYLEKAVKRYQASNGLAPTGIVDDRTRAALNVPAKARLRQLELGLQRLQEFTGRTGKGRYVAVNIPAAQVEAVDGDRVVTRHAGVVGKVDRKTPLLTSRIHELNFNPVWRLPPTVVHKDLIPKGRQMQKAGKNVLVKFGIDAYDGAGRKLAPESINWASGQPNSLSYRQQPGPDNPMGFLKINFHNGHSVYMHDTPSDSIFGRNFRAASSGCIRVAGIEQLAVWLLADQGGWDGAAVEAVKTSGETKNVSLKKPVTLHFVYITAWATEDGVVQFRRDLYNKDGLAGVGGEPVATSRTRPRPVAEPTAAPQTTGALPPRQAVPAVDGSAAAQKAADPD
ncbi:MAG: L,D-transpeptidase family protein [Hyphomicrobiaceae bacterium]|nr:L,D-transpeptidase family protein [Hyphomicrobiaceae bacterium]